VSKHLLFKNVHSSFNPERLYENEIRSSSPAHLPG
jgi:hypothetical protein